MYTSFHTYFLRSYADMDCIRQRNETGRSNRQRANVCDKKQGAGPSDTHEVAPYLGGRELFADVRELLVHTSLLRLLCAACRGSEATVNREKE